MCRHNLIIGLFQRKKPRNFARLFDVPRLIFQPNILLLLYRHFTYQMAGSGILVNDKKYVAYIYADGAL